MKTLTTFITILFISLLSSPSFSETVSMDDLVERDDLHYKKFSNTPFTGEISGKKTGRFKAGKRHGEWLFYNENGQLLLLQSYKNGILNGLQNSYNGNGIEYSDNYQNGKLEGVSKSFYNNGKLLSEGHYKTGKQDGTFRNYYGNGQIRWKGNFSQGTTHGLWEQYYENGRLKYIGNYKDGNEDGLWNYFNEDGSPQKTETYKDGELLE